MTHIGNTVAEKIYNELLKNVESTITTTKDGKKWGCVYLDNCRMGMDNKVFRANLAVLSKLGLYRVVDGYAFGDVLLTEEWLADEVK